MGEPSPGPSSRASTPSHIAYAVAAHIVWRDVDGELVIFDEESGRYHALDLVGSLIWRRLTAGATPELIADELAARYDAPADIIADDVARFIARAADLRLICAVAGDRP